MQNSEDYRFEFDGESNLGTCWKIYKLEDEAYVYQGQIFSNSKDPDKLLEEFLSD